MMYNVDLGEFSKEHPDICCANCVSAISNYDGCYKCADLFVKDAILLKGDFCSRFMAKDDESQTKQTL